MLLLFMYYYGVIKQGCVRFFSQPNSPAIEVEINLISFRKCGHINKNSFDLAQGAELYLSSHLLISQHKASQSHTDEIGSSICYPFILTFTPTSLLQQVRDLEQQLKEQRQPSVQSMEGESVSSLLLQRTPPGEKNLSHIRNIRKEKREALEVH